MAQVQVQLDYSILAPYIAAEEHKWRTIDEVAKIKGCSDTTLRKLQKFNPFFSKRFFATTEADGMGNARFKTTLYHIQQAELETGISLAGHQENQG